MTRGATSFEEALRAVFVLVVAATVVPFGSAPLPFLLLSVTLSGLLCAASVLVPIRSQNLAFVQQTTVLVVVGIGLYVVMQAVPLGSPYPLAQTASGALARLSGAMSIAPDITWQAGLTLVSPFLVFLSAIMLHQTDEAAFRLWRRLAYLGIAIAAFSLMQHAFFPNNLLFGEKQFYRDSLTGVFVNRNSMATFLGLTALGASGLLIHCARSLKPASLLQHVFECRLLAWRNPYTRFVVLSLCWCLVLIALALTKSRGGIVSTLIVLVPVSAWVGLSLSPERITLQSRLFLAGALSVGAMALLALLGSRVAYRIHLQGGNDDRWCTFGAVMHAIEDNPWFGTGFGAFQSVFPLYRDPACGIAGVWDRAHNSYLEAYLGLGFAFVPLLLVSLVTIGTVFAIGYRERRRFRFAPVIGTAMLGLVLLHSMVDFSIQIPGVASYFAAWMAAAVSLSLGRSGRPEQIPSGSGQLVQLQRFRDPRLGSARS